MTWRNNPHIHIMHGYNPEQGLELPGRDIRIANAKELLEYGGSIEYSALVGKGFDPYKRLSSEVRFRDLSNLFMVLGPYVTFSPADADEPFAPDASVALWNMPGDVHLLK